MKKEHLILALKQQGFQVGTSLIADILLSHQASDNAIDMILGTFTRSELREQFTPLKNSNKLLVLKEYQPLENENRQVVYVEYTSIKGFVRNDEEVKNILTSHYTTVTTSPSPSHETVVCGIRSETRYMSVYDWNNKETTDTPLYFIDGSVIEKWKEELENELKEWLRTKTV